MRSADHAPRTIAAAAVIAMVSALGPMLLGVFTLLGRTRTELNDVPVPALFFFGLAALLIALAALVLGRAAVARVARVALTALLIAAISTAAIFSALGALLSPAVAVGALLSATLPITALVLLWTPSASRRLLPPTTA